MTTKLIILLITSIPCLMFASEPESFNAFSEALRDAIRTRSGAELEALHAIEGTSKFQRDSTVEALLMMLPRDQDFQFRFIELSESTLTEFDSDTGSRPLDLKNFTEGRKVNGTLYPPTLPVVGFCRITWGDQTKLNGRMELPIGVTWTGVVRIIMWDEHKAEQGATADRR